MRLWESLPPRMLEEINHTDWFHEDWKELRENWDSCVHRLEHVARKMSSLPGYSGGVPTEAWTSKPDLEVLASHSPPGWRVLVEFEVPEDSYILVNADRWEKTVFNHPFFLSDQERDECHARWGISTDVVWSRAPTGENVLIDSPDYMSLDPKFWAEVMETWDRIFDLSENNVRTAAFSDGVKWEWITDVQVYLSHRKRRVDKV